MGGTQRRGSDRPLHDGRRSAPVGALGPLLRLEAEQHHRGQPTAQRGLPAMRDAAGLREPRHALSLRIPPLRENRLVGGQNWRQARLRGISQSSALNHTSLLHFHLFRL